MATSPHKPNRLRAGSHTPFIKGEIKSIQLSYQQQPLYCANFTLAKLPSLKRGTGEILALGSAQRDPQNSSLSGRRFSLEYLLLFHAKTQGIKGILRASLSVLTAS